MSESGPEAATLGFIGLGVMGSRMCANLIKRSDRPVVVYDPVDTAVAAATELGARAADSTGEVAGAADIVFLSLPSIVQVESVCAELVSAARPPRIIVDMSTSDVAGTRALATRLAESGTTLVDAPVARLRQAAEEGTLLITVGADAGTFRELEPLLSCMGSDIVHAGSTGNGQVLKILNNMVLFLNMNALAEALAIGRAAGVTPDTLFSTLKLGSADSFALRRTASATMLVDEFPERAFPVDYAIKDLALALKLAEDSDIPAAAGLQTMDLLQRTRDAGYGANYYPVMIKLVEGDA
ncbi:NAD(P)-dependent oxidoreductase [Nocardia zapadnayensis]|uniref:NAD(P)-dependent oxidoreductase n=1 Tax=Nocardia rhamnosiphila TaxID=426716 RepID=UPI002247F5BD|nr:NAD(P)-dependent oxidoreductase [Nocardia zapadnayensis]MCX0272758.1 NAD(P)-dependent oxidoreductase [Nocardia zapadnayensis]